MGITYLMTIALLSVTLPNVSTFVLTPSNERTLVQRQSTRDDDWTYPYNSPPPDFSVIDDDGTPSIPESKASDYNDGDGDDWFKDMGEDTDKFKSPPARMPPRKPITRANQGQQSASWMDRNDEFDKFAGDQVNEKENSWNRSKPGRDRTTDRGNKTFRQDFRGTRVFVQNLPPEANWQEVKDHFRECVGEVVFASVSSDATTGKSKCHGVVQFETTELAQTAIAIMRNHPMEGYQLYVREDVQEKPGAELQNNMPQKKGPTPPTKWKCANEENTSYLSEEEVRGVRQLIKARDDARRRRQYDASDYIREQLKREYAVHLDDRLKMWWTAVDGNQIPTSIQKAKGEGRWDAPKAWRQIPTTQEFDACVNTDLVNALLDQRDIARKEKDFSTADALLDEARNSPDGDLSLRIHDESRTWRIWTDEPPPRPVRQENKSPAEQCLEIVQEHAPEKIEEVQALLEKFPGREYNILKKLKQRYL